jgi:branched-chain amino acid transport system substrate-binding protein
MLRQMAKPAAGRAALNVRRKIMGEVRGEVRVGRVARLAAGAVALTAALGLGAGGAAAQTPVKLGVVTFLSGPAAGPFGVPARNAAEMLIAAINDGKVPAPYNTKGLGGAPIEPIIIDENGAVSKVVQDYRDLVQRREATAVVGYVSSGNCLGVAPVAEELQKLTVFFDCGTPRIFEDASYKYVFRATATATIDSVAAARYLLAKDPNVKTIGGINQNYAWGQDSWRDFEAAMKALKPDIKVTTAQFPKLFAGQFSSEISTMLTSGSDAIHSSFWGGDLESFILQMAPRGLQDRSKMIFTTVESAMFRLGSKIPDGIIVGARGPYGVLARDTELNRWFRQTYTDRYGTPPTYPSYHMATAIIGLKAAWDKAAKAKPSPSQDDVIAAFEHQEFEAFGSKVKMALGKGHQAITEISYGTYKFDKSTGTPTITDVIYYPPECVNPPEGVKSTDWIKEGMAKAKCG